MRALVLHGLGCAVASLPLAAYASTPLLSDSGRVLPAVHAGGVAAADSSTRQRFDLPAQSLPDALADFARQAGLRVSVHGRLPAGARSAGVAGTLTAAEALRRLLAGTDVTARFTDAQSVVVSGARDTGRTTAGAQELGAVVVTGTGRRAAGYGVRRTATATKTDTPLRDTPQAVTVVTRELIADQAMQSMADVVRYVPGVTMSLGEGHRDQPTIRGNSTTADFFVDGVRDDAQYLRDVYNVDRVEALKGANAMIFGRGGGGGVINRALKEAQWAPTRALMLEGGSFDHKRATLDVGQGLGQAVAARVNGVAERSAGFRDAARLERYGVNPTLAVAAGARTTVRAGYEYFRDDRRVDRGIPSFQGRPVGNATTTFFGNPSVSEAWTHIHAGGATVEHHAANGLTLRNRARVADYDKFYQNSFPSAVNAAGTQVTLSAYNHAIQRRNLFNQTEVTYGVGTGPLQHTLLAGVEVGRQRTDQFRNTGYFSNGTASGATTLNVPLAAPTVAAPISFRQSATDADNRATAQTGSVYVQDQIALSPRWQAILGLRAERFGIRYHNNRNGQELERTDHLLSPRGGLVFKPVTPVSLYGSYSVSYLPSTGDQFTALTVTSQTLKPEQFRNREVGAKWDVRPDLALTAAAYRLDRTNTAAPDPADPARTVQTGAQRTTGYEVGVTGNVTRAWQVAGGFAAQRATIISTTAAAKAGATVPLAPHRTVSLWNRYQVVRPLGLGLGVVHQGEMYTGIDNSVRLPRFTRLDGAAFVTLTRQLRAQVNVENVLDRRYFGTAFNNSNIMPGASRTVRISLTTGL